MHDLNIYFGFDGNRLRNPPVFFDLHFNNSWLDNDFTRKLLKDIEGVEVLGTRHYIHPYFGDISPRELSGGVKALLILYNLGDGKVLIDLAKMGQNCIRYLEDILTEKSLTVSCNTLFNSFTDLNFKGVCLNDNSRFSDWKELTEKQIYWLDRSPERNLPDGWE